LNIISSNLKNDLKVSPPVIICGMHRSGTSMVSQVLEGCGLYLGNKNDLLSSTQDNPSGYWEFRDLVEFSDQLLESIGASWNEISPLMSKNWLSKIKIEQQISESIRILETLIQVDKPWGWKDPRATILLPFWRCLLPNFKLIVCVRNPLEVAFSLSKRTIKHVDFQPGLRLWLDYNKLLMRDLENNNALFIHYEQILQNPNSEIRRLCNFLNLSPTSNDIANAKNRIQTNLYRGVLSNELFFQFEYLPPGITKMYQELCEKANLNFESLPPKTNTYSQKYLKILEKMLITSTNSFDNFFQLLEEQRSSEKTLLINDLKQKILEKDQEILFYAASKSWKITRPLRKIQSIFKINNEKLS